MPAEAFAPIDLAALAATPAARAPFDHVVVPGFVPPTALEAVNADFPEIAEAGSFPAGALAYGPAFAGLLAALEGEELRRALEAKFGLELAPGATLVTVRGRVRARDGRIHTDSPSKLLTVLVYLNRAWAQPGGRLRLLRSGDDIEDCVVEVAPEGGTLVAFPCGPDAWHGHLPAEGERRSLQLNWLTSPAVARREAARHRLSAGLKRVLAPLRGRGGAYVRSSRASR